MSNERPSVLALVSGGLDSSLMAVMLRDNGWNVSSMFVNYGQRSRALEWQACLRVHREFNLAKPLTMALPAFGRKSNSGLVHEHLDIVKDAFLPGRNMLFLLCAAATAAQRDIGAIAVGLLNEDNHLFPDQTTKFLSTAESALELSVGRPVKIIAPLMMFNKPDVLALAEARGLRRTYSCHAGGKRPCGKCISCREFSFLRR